jgi:hypothetical protein
MHCGVGDDGSQNSENREPQNIEQGISNDEVFFSFEIHYSLFDIRLSYLNICQNRGFEEGGLL